MTTKKTVSKPAAVHSASPMAAAPPAPATPPPAASPAPAAGVPLPPPLATIPSVPEGNQNIGGHNYVGARPRKLELAAMPDVLAELASFSNYTDVFGKMAPPLAYVIRVATAAAAWSGMRVKSVDWEDYARSEESAAWNDFRAVMDLLRAALAAAVAANPLLAQQYPALVRLFGARSVISKRGATTRAANKAAKAEGKPPARGPLAKKARRLKSAAATLAAAGETVTLPVAPTPVAQTAPATSPQPAAPTPPNGATHS